MIRRALDRFFTFLKTCTVYHYINKKKNLIFVLQWTKYAFVRDPVTEFFQKKKQETRLGHTYVHKTRLSKKKTIEKIP